MCDKNITESITIPKEKFLEYIIQSKKQTEKDKTNKIQCRQDQEKKVEIQPEIEIPYLDFTSKFSKPRNHVQYDFLPKKTNKYFRANQRYL